MKKIYYLFIFIFSFSVLSAQEKLSKEEKARREKNIQAGNPFAQFGYKAKIATLSKGKYLEFHDLDSIVTIGTVRWHVYKNEIVGRIVQDSLNPDAQPIGDRAGRWISPDPLSEEFPSWSPYNMCYDNPVKFKDPDGRAPAPPDDYVFNEKGKYVRTEENNKPDKLVIENSKTGKRENYNFNDPKTDVASIKENIKNWGEVFKDIKFIYTLSEIRINKMMTESGVDHKNYFSRNYFALTESVGGKIDFSMYHLSVVLAENNTSHIWDVNSILKDKGPLFLLPNSKTSYNLMDTGNFLWGNAMKRLGFTNQETTDAAKGYNKNDSNPDLKAINAGYKF
jgi:hypothetical protein